MEDQRKDDITYAVNIDTNPKNIKFDKFDNRVFGDGIGQPSLFVRVIHKIYDGPSSYIHDKIEAIRGKERPYYYHKKFKRVPTIDECFTDDLVCILEANEQLKRDMLVDKSIMAILRDRLSQCMHYHGYDDALLCEKLRDDCNKAYYNFEVKYGETGGEKIRSQDVYMKQKHRLIMERRKKLKEEAAQNNA